MGKASRWFRALLGLKKQDYQSAAKSPSKEKEKEKRRWSFVKSHRDKQKQTSFKTTPNVVAGSSHVDSVDDPNKHAIAVAAATAAVAEAAVAAAQAAGVVVRLTSSGRCPNAAAVTRSLAAREEWAAIKIQAAFRSYLARRALRALKGLVRLQALARGHIVRKQTVEWLRQMQALLRAQARARVGRAQVSESPNSSGKSSHLSHPGPATPEKFEHAVHARSAKYDHPCTLMRNGSRPSRSIDDQDNPHFSRNLSDHKLIGRSFDHHVSPLKTGPTVDSKDDKIVEIDIGKSKNASKGRNIFSSQPVFDSVHSSQTSTAMKGSTQSLHPMTFPNAVDESPFCTAENSPQFLSASSRGGSSRRSPFTPTKSDGSRSYLSGYSDCPSYMAYTESSKAKVRSLSAPKQRPHCDRSGSTKRHSINGFVSAQRTSSLRVNFASKAYPGSGRLDRLGLPVRSDGMVYRY